MEIAEINKEELLADFVEKLPTIRRKLNISQSRLGEMVGLSRQSISSIERGSVQLSWNTFLSIALVIFVNDPDIFGEITDSDKYMAIVESLKTDT